MVGRRVLILAVVLALAALVGVVAWTMRYDIRLPGPVRYDRWTGRVERWECRHYLNSLGRWVRLEEIPWEPFKPRSVPQGQPLCRWWPLER